MKFAGLYLLSDRLMMTVCVLGSFRDLEASDGGDDSGPDNAFVWKS
jgi:hypothetical protein